MSLNDILLNNHLLTQLYEHSLLEKNERLQAQPTQRAEQFAQPPSITNKETAGQIGGLTPSPTATTERVPPATKAETKPAVAVHLPEYGNTPALGGNKKGVLILVSNTAVPFLPDAELAFLITILGACKLGMDDVAIVNLHRYPQPYTELVKQFNSRQVLLFGITPQEIDLPFHFPHFQLQNFDQRTYLSSFPLEQIAPNRELKTQLWGCLKSMFGV